MPCYYRNHKAFSPMGTNVDFVEVINSHTIHVRTYERGVENETLACGTGSVASAIISYMRKGCNVPITVQQPGGKLYIEFNEDFSNLRLTGTAQIIYEGEILLPEKYK